MGFYAIIRAIFMVENRINIFFPYDQERKALHSKVAVLLFNKHWQEERGTRGGNDQDPYVEAMAIHIWPEAFFDRVKARRIIEALQIPGFGVQLVDQLGQPIDPFIRLMVPASRRAEFLKHCWDIDNEMSIEEQQVFFGKGLPLPVEILHFQHLTNLQIRQAISLEQESKSERAIQAQSPPSAYPMPVDQQRLSRAFNRACDLLSERQERAINSARQIDNPVLRAIITAPSILGRGYIGIFRSLAKFTGPSKVGDGRIEPPTSRSRTERSADELIPVS